MKTITKVIIGVVLSLVLSLVIISNVGIYIHDVDETTDHVIVYYRGGTGLDFYEGPQKISSESVGSIIGGSINSFSVVLTVMTRAFLDFTIPADNMVDH